ncbi:hypothetical protein B0H14DRAFT_3456081 [Mycena olivaceomarginata]|nr:hypothetical protein B0H14DRAFT_3456081 [Mycena olivaceomarginata]
MLPIHYLKNLEGYTATLQLLYEVPFKVGGTAETRVLTFKDMTVLDEIYKGVQTKAAARYRDGNGRRFDGHLDVSQTPNPVTPDNWDSFTDAQRELAEEAEVTTSLDDLKEKLADLHEGGVSQPGSYVEISSDILGGQTLHITGAEGKLVALFFEIPEQYRQALADAIEHIHAAMPGEFKDDNSHREAFQYFSCHYTWYARYAEKGKGAPAGVHPNKVHKKGAVQVNLSQRVPHLAKDILDHPQEYTLLAEAFSDFFEILRLAQYLPEDTAELSIYCESLSLHASSPCYPFGGFVINLQACTWAHRDRFDKCLCLVAPFGTFEGGQLCLYEAGLSFNL